MTEKRGLRVILFDMDGLLIDSEPLWRRAEVDVFTSLGVPLTESMCAQTMGMRIDAVVAYWFERYPWPNPDFLATVDRILDRMITVIQRQGKALPGAVEAVQWGLDRGIVLGLVTSSPMRLVRCVLGRLGLEGAFTVVHSAEQEAAGKPHPAVYLTAARMLRVEPSACVVLEDSVSGLLSAKAATMTAIAIPGASDRGDPRYGIADHVLDSIWEAPDLLESMLTLPDEIVGAVPPILCRGPRIALRDLGIGDQEAFLLQVERSRDLHEPWVSPPQTPDQFFSLVARRGAHFRSLLVVTPDGQCVGLYNVSQIFLGGFCSCYLGYYAFASQVGRGLMTEGLELVVHYAFHALQLHRLEANIQPSNLSSIRLVQRGGFVQEGFSPDYLRVQGRWRDHERWAIRREIWQEKPWIQML